MNIPKPSKYQLFLISMTALIIFFLLAPGIFSPREEEGKLRIGIVDSGCSINQSTDIVESTTFTEPEYGYAYSDNSVYDTVGHGRHVCEIIIDNTDDVLIYSARIANGDGQVTYEGLFAAVEYLIEEKDVDIINLSLGGEPYYSEDLFTGFENYADSVVIVAAIGNKANDFTYPQGIVDWPATLPWVIGVGSLEDSGERSVYSSFGRSSTGLYSTEFVEDGDINSNSGTSFSAPRVTVAVANAWQALENSGFTPNPEMLNYVLAKSTQQDNFNPELGWGIPNPNFYNYSEGVLLQGVNEIDPLQRFPNEKWQMQWKITGTIDNIQLQYSGNGTDHISSANIESYNWGKILQLEFNASINQGTYSINVSHPLGNSFEYSFRVTNQEPLRRILLDHRNTINGFAHQWGQYFNFEIDMRDNGIQVDQIQSGDVNLQDYDSVLVTEFGRRISLDRDFARTFDQNLFDDYVQYGQNGGKLQIFATYPDEFDNSGYSAALAQLGADITETRIPLEETNEIVYTPELTNIIQFTDVTAIGASGSSINAVNSSQIQVGYYVHTSTVTQQFSIGITTDIGSGSLFVWSGSKMLQNDYYLGNDETFDKFLFNYLELS